VTIPGQGGGLLLVSDLSVEYRAEQGSPVIAVDHVDLLLRRGEFLGIVGESGCGKSTLLYAIAHLLSPPAAVAGGSVLFEGQEMVSMTEKQLRRIRWERYSVVMQSAMNALNPVLTIAEQMRDACEAHADMPKSEIARRSEEVLRLVSIDPVHLGSYPHQLSGGMRQRAMIAMALLFAPSLVIMDEPTSALDVVAQRSLMAQVKELQAHLHFAVIFVTHDMSLVRHFADRLMVMYAGQVAELGPTATLFESPRHPYTRGLLEAFPSIRGPRDPLVGIPGSPPDLSHPPRGCRFQPRCRHAREECANERPAIETIEGDVLVRCLLYRDDAWQEEGLDGPYRRERLGAGDEPSVAATGTGLSAQVGTFEGTPVLETAGLTRHFRIGNALFSRKTLHAVDDVTLQIGRQEIVAVVGESGSGKTTVAKLLGMTYSPTAGEIRFEGRLVTSLRSRRDRLAYRGQVPMVFQDPYSSINGSYRVQHGLIRAMKLHRTELDRRARHEEAVRVMEAVGLVPGEVMLQKYPHELSGGQRQRVGFAQALALRPKLIIADEPVSMLDVSIRVGLLNLMVKLRAEEGVSFLYITHDMASARYVADRVLVMYAGHVVESGPAEQVLRAPRHPYTRVLLSASPDPNAPLELIERRVGEPPRVIDPGPGCRFAPRCPLAIERCSASTPELSRVDMEQYAACFVAELETQHAELSKKATALTLQDAEREPRS
jgi:peptide/nickel transport system ATP-binding protein